MIYFLAMTSLLDIAKAERDRLNKVIALLEGSERTGGKTKSKKSTRTWTPEQKKAASARQKAAWAKRKKEKA
jgi:hypothetical protein